MLKKIPALFVIVSLLLGLFTACNKSSTDEAAKELLATLTRKARLSYNQPGWVHVTENIVYDTDKKDRGTLSTGQTIPLIQIVDIWYHINDYKLVDQFVWNMSSQDGKTIETTVFMDNKYSNLTTNESSSMSPYSLTLDYQLENDMEKFLSKSHNHPVVKSVEMDGKKATEFTMDLKLDNPTTYEDFTQSVVATGTVAYFDSESGYLLKLERNVTLADGTKRNYFTDDIVIDTGAQPTQDIINYVNGIW
jgi:hypothetical protein